MTPKAQKILAGIGIVGLLITSYFFPRPQTGSFGTTIPTVVSLFETSLASNISSSDTSMTLVSGTDRAGNSLSGTICFVIDSGTASAEFVCGTASGTAITSLTRGLDPQNPNTSVAALQFAHRRGADVKVSDFPQLAILSRIMNGTDTFPNIISYASAPTFASNLQIIDKQYADGLAIAGSPNASTSVQGLVQEATTAQLNAGTATGSTGAKLFASPADIAASIYGLQLPSSTQKLALVGNNTDIAVGSGNLYITQTGLQKSPEAYALTTGSANAYVAALSPVPTSYAAGMTLHLKTNFQNTGSATVNVNSLGAQTIKRVDGASLASGDILSGELITLVYDGTNFQLQNTSANAPQTLVRKVGKVTYDTSTASGTQTIAHGLGITPKKVRVTYAMSVTGTPPNKFGWGSWDGTNTASITYSNSGAANALAESSSTTNIIAGSWQNATDTANATISADATNITLTWTKVGTPTGTLDIMWEAEGN